MNFDDYRSIDAVNWSTLRHMADSPLHYRHHLTHQREDSTRLLLGRAAHTAILEPVEFADRYPVFAGSVRRGKEWDAFCSEHEGAEILKVNERDQSLAIAAAVRANRDAAALLNEGQAEVSRQWDDILPCKCRIDWLTPRAIVDVKTARTTDVRKFSNDSAAMLYHCQHAFYARAFAQPMEHYAIVVELDPPHDVAVFEFPDWVVDEGRAQVEECLIRLKSCRERDSWPGRYSGIQAIELPIWATFGDDTGGLFGGGE